MTERSTARIATGCAAVLGLTLALTATVPAGAAGGSTEPQQRLTAEEVHHFLEGFYGNSGPRRWERKHLVTEALRREAAEAKGYDLLVCTQNKPLDMEVDKVTVARSAAVGRAPVWLEWGEGQETRPFTAYVELDAGRLKLARIDCEPPVIDG